MSKDTLVEGSNLKKIYRMGEVSVHALRGVNVNFYDSEMVVVLGASGSGKSTLVNIVGGMDRPSEGELYINGKSLHEAGEVELTLYRRNEVGFIFQFYNLMPNLTARENIELSVQVSPNPMEADRVLELVGLSDRADHFPSQLSGGEQQRVAVGRALAKNPRLMLCDEPTGALDLARGRQILKLLRDFCDDYQKTVIIITHNTNISNMADRVVYLKDGQVEWVQENKAPIAAEEVSW